jgi:hypothetical protein
MSRRPFGLREIQGRGERWPQFCRGVWIDDPSWLGSARALALQASVPQVVL